MSEVPDDLDELLDETSQAFARLTTTLATLTPGQLGEPSVLPGWSRAHVLGHLARNADGQRRMLEGAIDDRLVEQYDSEQARSADIERAAEQQEADLLADVQQSQDRLADVWQRMSLEAWARLTLTRAGPRPAWASLRARWRELDIHHVDLRLGYGPADWPATFVHRTLPRCLDGIGPRLPSGRVRVADAQGAVLTEAGDPEAPVTQITGDACWLLAWTVGRHAGAGEELTAHRDGRRVAVPELTPWA